MSEIPNKPNPSKLKLSKKAVKDMPLRAGQAGKVKGGVAAKAKTCVNILSS